MERWFAKNVGVIVISCLVFSAISPVIFVQKWANISFMQTGQIGDTIGGITSPFINGLAALLVYFAFKEQLVANELVRQQFMTQIEANKMLEQQQYFSHVESQINRLEDDFMKIGQITKDIARSIVESQKDIVNFNEQWISCYVDQEAVNKATYLTSVFEYCFKNCDASGNSGDYLKGRLGILYRVIYKDYFKYIFSSLSELQNVAGINVIELLLELSKLDRKLSFSTDYPLNDN